MRPLVGPVSLEKYLVDGQIEQVLADGESYEGARPCHYEWVKGLREECERREVTFVFCTTGRCFVKDGKTYHIEKGSLRSEQAARSGLSYQGKKRQFVLRDPWGDPIPEEYLYQPHFRKRCESCGMKLICNGCSDCGRCGK